jgi:2-C-methyl-D-erythritol 4-phosphate cytidylyltransferase
MVSAVILAGGRGNRVGFKKQFFRVGGRRILEFSVEVFKSLGIEDIVLVLPKEDVGKFDGLRVVEGGRRGWIRFIMGFWLPGGSMSLYTIPRGRICP